jgi:ribonuclease HII
MVGALPSIELEERIRREEGLSLIAGLDEAGRGAIAGPVYAAAVMLPLDDPEAIAHLMGVNDSKLLSPAERERWFELILRWAMSYGIAGISAALVDEIGVLPATFMAMEEALVLLDPPAEFALVDGPLRLPSERRQLAVVRGDRLSLSIAAASVLAKASRDRHMVTLGVEFPGYEFGRHKGYATAHHLEALAGLGPCPIHRRSFAPLRLSLLELIDE